MEQQVAIEEVAILSEYFNNSIITIEGRILELKLEVSDMAKKIQEIQELERLARLLKTCVILQKVEDRRAAQDLLQAQQAQDAPDSFSRDPPTNFPRINFVEDAALKQALEGSKKRKANQPKKM